MKDRCRDRVPGNTLARAAEELTTEQLTSALAKGATIATGTVSARQARGAPANAQLLRKQGLAPKLLVTDRLGS